jgi:hypothetical protein
MTSAQVTGHFSRSPAYHLRKSGLEGVKKDEVDRELGYFLHNASRMRYDWFRSRGLFVGSGLVESGCKAVTGQRLKLSGMHWTIRGADAITALRCEQASLPASQIWQRPHNQTASALPVTAGWPGPADKLPTGHLQNRRTPGRTVTGRWNDG